MPTKTVCAIVGIFLGLSLAVDGVRAQTGTAQSAGAGQAPKMAEEVYKNIQVLKGVPAELLHQTMEITEGALGVGCGYCHAGFGDFEKDTPRKLISRLMMKMVMDINKENFGGRPVVSCYTCHRGHALPVNDMATLPDDRPQAVAAGAAQPETPSADKLFDQYIQATGGMDALTKITSRVARGNFLSPDGRRFPAEVYVNGPDNRVILWQTVRGDDSVGYNGKVGWIVLEQRFRVVSTPDLEGMKLENDLYLATHVKQLYSQWRVMPSEKVGDREAHVLSGTTPGRVPIQLFLDKETGLLLRVVHFTETPVGSLPTQVDYEDYRTVGRVMVPFRLRSWRAGPGDNWSTIQLEQVEHNVPVDQAKFVLPILRPSLGQIWPIP